MNTQGKAVKLAGRRRFLKACGLAGIGAIVCSVTGAFRKVPGAEADFIVISGWVLPSRHFAHPADD